MFVIEIPYFDLDKTYNSSQMLRWKKLRDGKYVVVHRNIALKVEQQKNRLIMSCSADDFYDIWFDYFDIAFDYQKANRAIKKVDDFCHIVAVKQQGVRIIRQDVYEMLITQLLVDNAEEESRKMIQNMCELIDTEHIQSMREAGKVKWYEFPDVVQIKKNEDIIESIFGKYKKELLIEFIERYVEDLVYNLSYDSDNLKYKESKRYIKDCELFDRLKIEKVCAYALGFKQAFVPDKIIKTALKNQYGLTCREFIEWFDAIKDIKALAFLYIDSNEREKEAKGEVLNGSYK